MQIDISEEELEAITHLQEFSTKLSAVVQIAVLTNPNFGVISQDDITNFYLDNYNCKRFVDKCKEQYRK